MKKELLPILIALPLVAVKAQTFQRQAQQPAFFMPKSVVTAPQPERLPSVESMNYQGQRISNQSSSPFIGAPEYVEEVEKNNDVMPQNTVATEPLTPKSVAATSEETQKSVIKEEKPRQVVTENSEPKKVNIFEKVDTAENSEKNVTTENKKQDSDNYQEIFAKIIESHKNDLNLISKGQPVNNPEIERLIDSYTPEVHKITDTIDVRKIKL